MLTRRLAPTFLVVLLLLVAACGEDDPEAGPLGAPSPSGQPTLPEDLDHPEEGVDLVDRPRLDGVYERALQTYVDFERGRRQAAREGAPGRLLSFNATADVVDPYREAFAAYGGGPDHTYDGTVVIEFLDARPRDGRLVLDICVDATALLVPDGAPTLLGEATRAPQRIVVTNLLGPWRVTEADPVDGSC